MRRRWRRNFAETLIDAVESFAQWTVYLFVTLVIPIVLITLTLHIIRSFFF